jgi:hypothetical protein
VSGTPLSQLERFGLSSEWMIWRLQRGGLDDWCERCRGSGYTVKRPCPGPWQVPCAGPVLGCKQCRHRCWVCKGRRLRPADVIRSEDFGDPASFAIAKLLNPTLAPDPRPRTDHNPPALAAVDPRGDGDS